MMTIGIAQALRLCHVIAGEYQPLRRDVVAVRRGMGRLFRMVAE